MEEVLNIREAEIIRKPQADRLGYGRTSYPIYLPSPDEVKVKLFGATEPRGIFGEPSKLFQNELKGPLYHNFILRDPNVTLCTLLERALVVEYRQNINTYTNFREYELTLNVEGIRTYKVTDDDSFDKKVEPIVPERQIIIYHGKS
jgi:hypothetical protein